MIIKPELGIKILLEIKPDDASDKFYILNAELRSTDDTIYYFEHQVLNSHVCRQ